MTAHPGATPMIAPPIPARPAAGIAERWRHARTRTRAIISRRLRWEFWPAWMIYAPLAPHLLRLAFRHRSLTAFTAANPAMPLGGVIGESKWDILSRLPESAVVPAAILPPAPAPERSAALLRIMQQRAWSFPIILKPDVGQRGAGVELTRSHAQALAYLAANPGPVIAQVYHPGPFEAGIFYIRHPGEPRGRIFSITDKRFPLIHGDGRSTLRNLIWNHPRYRLQAHIFIRRLGPAAGTVPGPGEPISLGIAGNHCQGSMFLDGAHLITDDLTNAVDRIAQSYPGFHFGRFDVRYSCVEAFRAGRDLAIVELNGVSSESTNMYDPRTGYWAAQRTLRDQWRLAFEIGSANSKRGHPPATLADLLHACGLRPARARTATLRHR
ncbi:MAG: hypothetical protein KF745_00680 [Phycisphaeraceae bacterium]|nr:hypothetical protein [Phycisphaeraceae bacterium]